MEVDRPIAPLMKTQGFCSCMVGQAALGGVCGVATFGVACVGLVFLVCLFLCFGERNGGAAVGRGPRCLGGLEDGVVETSGGQVSLRGPMGVAREQLWRGRSRRTVHGLSRGPR